MHKEPVKHLKYIGQPNREREIEYLKPNVRGKVEPTFYIVKRVFGYGKVAYRGIVKNSGRLYTASASTIAEMGVDDDAGTTGCGSLIGIVRGKSPVKRRKDGRLWEVSLFCPIKYPPRPFLCN
ncbi:MAG: hypothetical protein LBB61_06070 [Treponema sp.]|nr:hypothetical protein [Treponema sp.]